MTDDRMALRALLEKGSDAELLHEMVSYVTQRLMDFEVENLCGAGFNQRSDERSNHRNGYRQRRWETRAGAIDLKIPKLRKGRSSCPCSASDPSGRRRLSAGLIFSAELPSGVGSAALVYTAPAAYVLHCSASAGSPPRLC